MILVKPSYQILALHGIAEGEIGSKILELIEQAGRTCYKSESLITKDSAKNFVESILKRGHESVIEHSYMSVRMIVDRGVTHEIVRHRLCAFSQESTRYVNYKGGCTFVIPPWIVLDEGEYKNIDSFEHWQVYETGKMDWILAMLDSEERYQNLIKEDWTPQQARSVLPNSTKTEIVWSANLREWRHILKLRCDKAAHPQMQEIMRPLLDECKILIPVIFDDISY